MARAGAVTLVLATMALFSGCGGSGAAGKQNPRRPPGPRGPKARSEGIAGKSARDPEPGAQKRVLAKWGGPLPGAKPPRKKPPRAKATGDCAAVIRRNRRCVDQIVEVALNRTGAHISPTQATRLKKKMRKALMKTLGSDTFRRKCERDVARKKSQMLRQISRCLAKPSCTGYAHCLMSLARKKGAKPSP